eukprot:323882-Pelagomonas_calceolata.AAC.3
MEVCMHGPCALCCTARHALRLSLLKRGYSGCTVRKLRRVHTGTIVPLWMGSAACTDTYAQGWAAVSAMRKQDGLGYLQIANIMGAWDIMLHIVSAWRQSGTKS